MNGQLFEGAGSLEPAAVRPTLIVTNRSNVLDFISAGLLRPRVAMAKYYPDTLELVPGVIPVVAAPVSAELAAISANRPMQFPVIVEIEPGVARPTDDARVGFVDVEGLDVVVRVHLETVDDREELLARTYDNVDWSRLDYEVSPAMFSGGDLTPDQVASAVTAAKGDADPPPFELEDRLGGGRLLALHAAPRDPVRLEHVARLAFEPPRKRGRRKTTALGEWLRVDGSLVAYKPAKSAGYDERLFLAAAAVCLEARRHDSWDGARFVDEIARVLAADPDLPAAHLTRWSDAAQRIRDIVNATRAFEGFTSTEYTSEAAILLAALRGGVEDVLAWGEESVGGDRWNCTIAALLVGLVHGRTAVGSALRDRALDEALAGLERDRLSGRSTKRLVVLGSKATGQGVRLSVDVDGRRVLSVDQAAPSTADMVRRLDFDNASTLARLLDIAADRGWDDAVTTTIRFSGPFEQRPATKGSVITFRGAPQIARDLDREVFLGRAERDDSETLRASLSSIGPESVPGRDAVADRPPSGDAEQ